MAVLQMQKISICALKKDRKAVLEKLQRMKVMEISQILEEDPDFTTMDTRQERMALHFQIRHWKFWIGMRRRRSRCFLHWKGKR